MAEKERHMYRCKFIRLIQSAIKVSGDLSIEIGRENLRRINAYINQKIFLEKEKEKERIGDEINFYTTMIRNLNGMDSSSIKNIIDLLNKRLLEI